MARISHTKAAQARRLLSGRYEESEDELAGDDGQWQWIYSNDADKHIEGARLGSRFQCKLGDCVSLKADGSKEAWIAIICDFLEEDTETEEPPEKMANFMWFSSEKEIRNKQKKRTDILMNERYITPSFDVNPLASINGAAQILSPQAFKSRYPSGRVPKNSPNFQNTFVCRRGCNTRTASYTDEFVWENLYRGAKDLSTLIELVKAQTKASRTKRAREEDNDAAEWDEGVDDLEAPETPKKTRKLPTNSTPKSRSNVNKSLKFTTPTHKRIVVKKALEFTPLGTRILSPSHTASSPFQIARIRLHVSSVPASLPCREEAFAEVYSHLEAAISDGSGSCIYISGTPGTGKTATVREVVCQLNAAVLADELDDFIFVEINGMKITDPHQSYSLLWEALRGERVSPTNALTLLEREFNNPSPRRVPCVVLMDELDQLVTKNQGVMYNFFNWPGLRHSRLIVLAVANTMDLPERTLSNKISSRLGLTRITFPGYTHDQLMQIIHSRLNGVPGDIVDPDAIQFASRKVAAVSGDARRALDICRRAVEIAEGQLDHQEDLLETPSRRHDRNTNKRGGETVGKVMISTIKQAISEATSSPLQQCLRALPLAAKVILAALIARLRRSGLVEANLGDVFEEAKRMGQIANESSIHECLLADDGGSTKALSKVAPGAAPRVCGSGIAVYELAEAGIVSLEPKRGERTGKVRLNIGEDEVKLALKDDPEVRDLGFSG